MIVEYSDTTVNVNQAMQAMEHYVELIQTRMVFQIIPFHVNHSLAKLITVHLFPTQAKKIWIKTGLATAAITILTTTELKTFKTIAQKYKMSIRSILTETD